MKGRLRGYLERIQSHAQCIVLYGSQRVELKYLKRLIWTVCQSMLNGSINLTLINFPIQLSCKKKKSSGRISKSPSSPADRLVHIHDALDRILLYPKNTKSRTGTKPFE